MHAARVTMRAPLHTVLWLVCLGPSFACGSSDADGPGAGGPNGKADVGDGQDDRLQWCAGHEHPAVPSGGWNHAGSSVWASGAAHHTAQDVVANPGGTATIQGKFTYGALSKDLEGEVVRVWLGDCDGFRLIDEVLTDGDGRIEVALDASLPTGVYDLQLEVAADGSAAHAKLWLLPAGTHVVITDIDGTLTTTDAELMVDLMTDFFEPILAGDYVPKAYPGGPELLRAHAEHGAILVYLTGRPHSLTDKTREWLTDLGFPAGIVHTTDRTGEWMPTDDGVGLFKFRYLRALREGGLVLDAAYGNAATDIHGYAAAQIPPAATWIIGPHAGEEGTNAVEDGWEARAAEVRAAADVTQPFAW